MQEFNYRQEFPVVVDFYYNDEHGKITDFGFPPFDFKIFFWTASKENAFMASCNYVNGVPHYVNCKRHKDSLVVVFDRHRLTPGLLHSELVMEVPDDLYPDGYRRDPFILHSDIKLIHGPTPAPTLAQIKAILPYVKGRDGRDGKDMTYDDMTEEQKEDLAERVAENVQLPDLSGMDDITDAEFDDMFTDTAILQK